ncbi:MAG: deoxyribose-phosphate aldolase [Proteobacteria bacterium]|nr:deoxyribose-phosphate aldolase [Pseudomonadota bacterium]
MWKPPTTRPKSLRPVLPVEKRYGSVMKEKINPKEKTGEKIDLADYIDHTLLKPEATEADIEKLCREAVEHGFKAVCVNSSNVALAAELLKDQKPVPVAVVGFPLGAAISSSKAFEAKEAVKVGAKEIDMVVNLGALKAKHYRRVVTDIQTVVTAVAPYPVKVIIETGSLNTEEKTIACALAKAAGAVFVKTSTGFGEGGAVAEDVALMRRIVGGDMGVKASGGIKTKEDALKMIEAGATRLGTSASVDIVSEK